MQRNAQAARARQAGPPVPAAAGARGAADEPADPQLRAWTKLSDAAKGDLRVRLREPNRTPLLLKGALQRRVPAAVALAGVDARQASDVETAREFLRANRELLLLKDPDVELVLVHYQEDELGRRQLRFEQRHLGLPVWPCEVTVHLNRDGHVDLMNGAYIPTPAEVGARPAVSAEAAVAAALRESPDLAEGRASAPELVVFGPLDKPARLAWKFQIERGAWVAWRFVIDALDGRLLQKINLVQHAAVQGSGVDGRGNTRALNVWQEGGTFYMVDTSKPMFDARSNPPNNPRGAILVFDGANKEVTDPQFSAGLVRSSSATAGWDPDAVGAAYGLSKTYDYYLNRFNRNSLDGQGSNVRAIVRYGQNVNNAFWFGTTRTMVFGFGNTREIDISGHELTHGVINSVGNGGILEYVNQSGALNEALADIFGENVQFFAEGGPDWLKRDVFEPDNRDKLIQDYANPTSVLNFTGQPNPSKMSEFVRLSENQDNGGVHVNSSIINHCYYLLAVGMEGAIGIGDAERIFYRAMTAHLQKQSQFIDMRHACVNSAEEVFGADSPQHRMTAAAFDRVEIFDAPTTPPPSPIPTVNAPDSTLLLREDFFSGQLFLVRREQALGDPVGGTFLDTADFVAPRKLSVSGDGSFAVFVSQDNDAGFIATDGSGLSFADLAGQVHAVAMAPNGRRYALVLNDRPFGQPSNEINIIDLTEDLQDVENAVTITLFAPTQDGGLLDVVQFADAMEFTPDSQRLIYDAFSVIKTEAGGFGGWSLFALDVPQQVIRSLIDINEGFDFGNASLGNVRPNLVTYEVLDKATDTLAVFASDLQTGATTQIAVIRPPQPISIPVYAGDDSAIIYAQRDLSVVSGYSLVRQAVAADGLTPVGQPTLWMADGNFAAIYRRGDFVAANQPPQVAITSPTPGQTLTAPASFDWVVTASDPDGTIARVEFYLGGQKVAEDPNAPFSVTVETASAGTLRLTARAIDNLGAATDSEAVEVTVIAPGGGNRPPEIAPISPVSVAKGQTLTVQVVATDPDAGQTLTYSLEPGAPVGASINPTTGVISWPVSAAASPGTFVFVVRVTDNGTPPQSATRSFNVTVTEGTAIRLTARRSGAGLVELVVSGGKANDTFRLEAADRLGGAWTAIATLVQTGETVRFIDPDSLSRSTRFYRAVLVTN
jgi:Zn-dependent metalloprotease